MLYALSWVSIGNGDQSALHMEGFAEALAYLQEHFLIPFFQNGPYRFGYVVAFALMATCAVLFFNLLRRVW